MARNALTPFRSGGLTGTDPFVSLHREMNQLFDDVLRGTGFGLPVRSEGMVLAPQINVSETDTEIRITAEMPGVSEKDIHVDLNDDILTIRGEKKLEHKDENENFHFVERSYGTFQRAVQLPSAVDPQKVQATFENGVLSITLPKNIQQQRSHRIEVRPGGTSQSGSQATGQSAGQGSNTQGQSNPEGKPDQAA